MKTIYCYRLDSKEYLNALLNNLAKPCKLDRSLEDAVDVSHLHDDALELGEVLDGHLAVLPAEAWKSDVMSKRNSGQSQSEQPDNIPPDILYPPKGTSTGLTL